MRIFSNALEAGRWAVSPVAAIGKFDGMHRGHLKLLKAALARAKALKAPCLAVTFDPLPQQFFMAGEFRPLLTLEERLRLMGELGVDAAVILPFNQALACQAPEAFARDVIADQLKASAVFVGEDFCFGKDRSGRVGDLDRYGRELGFTVHPVPLLVVGGERVSSERIRRLISEGKTSLAEKLLGRRLDGIGKRQGS